MQIVVGRLDDVCPVHVQRDDVLVSVGVLADQADIVAQSVHGHVACHGKGFEEVDLFVADGKRARTVHFADDGNFIIGHANRHNGVFFDVSFQLFPDQTFRFAFGQSAEMEGAQHGEVDVAPVVDQILLKGRLAGQAFLCIADRGGYGQVERFCQFRIAARYNDGEQILRQDAGIIELGLCNGTLRLSRVLQVGYFLVGLAGSQQNTG